MTALRGLVRSGNSGGPMVDGDGRVVTTIFAATTTRGDARRLRRPERGRARGRSTDRRRAGVAPVPCARLSADRYPRAAMAKTLVIAEKPSVGRDLARVLPGAFQKHEGYLEADEHVMTWAVGHLVQLAEPDEYDPKYKKWRMADLPIVPDAFKLVVRDERSKKQMSVITKLLKRDDVDAVVNACDAGREGELIFAWTLREGERAEAGRAAVAVLDDHGGDQAARSATCARATEFARLEEAARSRSEADWIVGMNATRAATIRLRSSFDGAVSLGPRADADAGASSPAARRRSARSSPSPTGSSTRSSSRRPASPAGATRAATTPAPSRACKTAAEAEAIVAAVRGQAGEITKLEKSTQEGARAAPLRPHVAAARGQHALRLLRPAHARGRAAALRGAQGAHLPAHQLALPDRRHGRARSSRPPSWSASSASTRAPRPT